MVPSHRRPAENRGLRGILIVLAGLFLLRTLGQLVQTVAPVPWLADVALWHSAALPYPALFATQVVILGLMGLAIRAAFGVRQRPILGQVLCSLAGLYAAVMAVRFALGATDLAAAAWFDAPIATPLHLALAGFLFLAGVMQLTPARRGRLRESLAPVARCLSYPLVLAMAVALFFWLRRDGAPLAFSAYLPVLLAGTAVLSHEMALPAWTAWTPDRQEVAGDTLFMVVVQMLLPALLTLLIVDFLTNDAGAASVGPWPHHWPVAAQALVMLLAADVLRYWVHRAAHLWMPLWRLHAVHHSPSRLYFLNVGRFHPLDKTLQFLVDTAPFILLGVSGGVVSAYFVFYAVNGFYQHSNADLRLGWLNWVVSGPELHRWHHSVLVEESNRNFGNNLIIWDVLFGTRFLPRDRHVGDLGLHNKSYPTSFIGQTIAPLSVNPNTA